MKRKSLIIIFGGLAALFAVFSSSAINLPQVANQPSGLYAEAQQIVNENGFNADPAMVVTMAKIESNFNPLAVRFEPHINDSSYGLMQTLYSTAKWLATDMGYNRYGVPSETDLFNREKSLYFGAAYIDYLSNYGGVARDEAWIVESYNGGPHNSNKQTQNHLRKYYEAKESLAAEGVI
jgi:soluble lytic murein transglycosylase-like protein